MHTIARLGALLCVVTLLGCGCGPSQVPSPSAVPTQPERATQPQTEPAPPATQAPPTLEATNTPAPEAAAASVTPPPAAVPSPTAAPPSPTSAPQLSLSSTAFAPGGEIPVRHSCFGENLSPPLTWSGIPAGTASLALVVDDPDSEPAGFVHWVVYNLPPDTLGLPEAVPIDSELEDGTLQGANDFAPFVGQTFPSGAAINGVGYAGPCPPGRHRYVFTLYALDSRLDLPAEAAAAQVLTAMQGHILTQALLAGVLTPPQ